MAKFLAEEVTRSFVGFLKGAMGSILRGGYGDSGGTTYLGGASYSPQFYPYHSGGIVGKDVLQQRQIDLLPRYHSGIGPKEQLAVLRKDEGVFTPGQMKALGNRELNVQVNLENQSGQPMKAKQSSSEFDGKKYVINVILEDINKGGVLRGALR
jgi:hypothetical protein